ncbi:hypothetical protein [Chryseolinea lacunae]|uniref:HMA domain-containing protein n=1 Tax=Chryseolinea lacunae TaxID=2801331 RepID=A0ABS1KPS0_9BACT|nr:hypothetical protein [Chryseolinea lacunae]MBL0740692.1 hypothetical protein [Chryseolinea lacunae]
MIYVFKTSVATQADVQRLKPVLQERLENAKWTFDLDDCDKVLRVDSKIENEQAVIQLLRRNGYDCEALQN